MKKVYFVRHGMTGGNETHSYQHLETPLSETGRKQAEFLAERFSKIKFDVLIASTMERAQETAKIIAKKTNHELISEKLFHEVLKPSVVRGKQYSHPEALEVMNTADSLWNSPNERHSDEENFHDIKKRAVEALEYLKSRKEEVLVVVTHGTFLKMLVSVMIRGENVDSIFFDEIHEFLYPENTGITWVEYDNKYHPNKWQLHTWNDHAHLG